MFLAPIPRVQKLVLLLLIFVAANPHLTFAQKDSTEHAKQRRAGQVADRFVVHGANYVSNLMARPARRAICVVEADNR